MIPVLYRGSVKDVLGPVRVDGKDGDALVFQYTDAFSVFDWGRMPDTLEGKGAALAVMAATLFERLEDPSAWRDFSKTREALALRKGAASLIADGASLATAFNELGEKLQSEGLRTHYLGVAPRPAPARGGRETVAVTPLSGATNPFDTLAVRKVNVVRPRTGSVLGRPVIDYQPTRTSPLPRLVPLEVIFRYSLPPGSSLIERVRENSSYLASLAMPDGSRSLQGGERWEFPLLEMSTKLETTDRYIGATEAVNISGLTAEQLQDLLMRTAWVSGFVKAALSAIGAELADGKLEWGMGPGGELFLVDAIGPDELRILRDGVQLSKEFLRGFYRKTPWYDDVNRAKERAPMEGITEWKKLVKVPPPGLPARMRELGSQVYLSLANELAGRKWFPGAMSVSDVVAGIRG